MRLRRDNFMLERTLDSVSRSSRAEGAASASQALKLKTRENLQFVTLGGGVFGAFDAPGRGIFGASSLPPPPPAQENRSTARESAATVTNACSRFSKKIFVTGSDSKPPVERGRGA